MTWCIPRLRDRGLLFAACLAFGGARAAAQGAPAADPFGSPRSPLRCEQLPPDSTPGVTLGYRFSDGTVMVDDRDVEVLYDVDGRPWSLTLIVTDLPTNETLSVSRYLVQFGRDSSGIGAVLRWTTKLDGTPVAGADSTGVRSDLVELGESELQRARDFAKHLWSIRCGRR